MTKEKKILVLAEKPDQAKKYAKSLGNPISDPKNKNVFIIKNSPYLKGEIHIVAARGHLLEYDIETPKWSLDTLPIIPKEFKFKVIDKDADVKKRYNTIKKEVAKCDEIIIGTDADREGERIAWIILSTIPNGLKKTKYRLWINSLTSEAIKKSFQNLRPASETKNFYEEAEARSQSDWLVGINLTRLARLDMKQKGLINDEKITIGRVQTPVVALIVKNDYDIENFVPVPYFTVHLIDLENNILFSTKEDIKFADKNNAINFLNNLSKQAIVKTVETELKEESSPALFDLNSLQGYCNKKFGFDSEETLGIVQSLYQKEYLTYPRTDSKYITHFEFEYLKQNFDSFKEFLQFEFELKHSTPRKKYVNDSKVQEHFAIVPTDLVKNPKTLTNDKERKVYQEVIFRTMLMFAENYQYEQTKVEIDNQNVLFQTKGKRIVDEGYKKYLSDFGNTTQSKDILLPNYQVDETLTVDFEVKDKKTQCPSRITEASLIESLMAKKYKLGTTATRAGIVQNVLKKGYIKKNSKTSELFPTEVGKKLIFYLQNQSLADPRTTKKWEEVLSLIGSGKIKKEEFIKNIQQNIILEIDKVKGENTK